VVLGDEGLVGVLLGVELPGDVLVDELPPTPELELPLMPDEELPDAPLELEPDLLK